MKLIAKAALGALALASAFAATVPANAAVVERQTTVIVHRGCFAGNCFHRNVDRMIARHMVRRAIRHEMIRQAFRHERHEAVRQAFLEHRFQYNR